MNEKSVKKNWIFHLDFDNFFVNCEILKNPELKNKSLVVASDLKNSVISSCSKDLKDQKIRPGMPLHKIPKNLEVKIIKSDIKFYSSTSEEIFKFIKSRYSIQIEIYSIDEIFFIFKNKIDKESAIKKAKEIQSLIMKNFFIPCSIGVSFSKFSAKMATNLAKNFGIKIVSKEDFPKFFWHLDVEKFWGIGEKNCKILKDLGIEKIGELAIQDLNNFYLRSKIGIKYIEFLKKANGYNSDFFLLKNPINKSISKTKTFSLKKLELKKDKDFVMSLLKKILEEVFEIKTRSRLLFSVLSVLVREKNRNWKSSQIKIKNSNYEFDKYLKICENLFLKNEENEIRGIGIKISDLNKKNLDFKNNLFKKDKLFVKKNYQIEKIIKKINQNFGKIVLKKMK